MSFKFNNNTNYETKPFKILNRKSDETGRTLYHVEEKNGIRVWIPFEHLKMYKQEIKEFEKNYEERITCWKQTSITKIASPKKAQHNPANELELSEPTIHSNQYTNKTVPPIKPQEIPNPQKLQQNNKDTTQEKSKKNEKEEIIKINKAISKAIKRTLKNAKETKFSEPNPPKSTQSEIIKPIEIKQIFNKNDIWYAKIMTNQYQIIEVLRDELKILNPSLLFKYYEKEYEEKKKYQSFMF